MPDHRKYGMRLVEIQNFPISKRRVRKLPRGYYYDAGGDDSAAGYIEGEPRVAQHRDVEHLGTGSFASTYTNKNKPFDVRKISKPDPARYVDGFFWYIKAISKTKNSTNPYFPKVRNLKVYTSNRGQVYTVEMERLFNLESLEPEEVQPILERIFGENNTPASESFIDVVYAIEEAVSNPNIIADKNLIEAVHLINNVAKKRALGLDIHDGNIMVRRTSVGPQIVITDPLAI